jgi:hypothetical protein
MSWEPINLSDLQEMIRCDLAACSDEQRAFFARVAIQPEKWGQSSYGDEGGGFWAVAVKDDLVLWYNDIEGGFNVSRFATRGTIPGDEYWCNQDPLQFALPMLMGEPGSRLGPPESI